MKNAETIFATFSVGDTKQKTKLSVSLAKAKGAENAYRILRLCGQQLMDGKRVDDVQQLRAMLFNQCSGRDEGDTAAILADWLSSTSGATTPGASRQNLANGEEPTQQASMANGTTEKEVKKEVHQKEGKEETAIKEELTKDVKTKDTKGAKEANATPVKIEQQPVDLDAVEDAPPESAAHAKVRHKPSNGACAFKYQAADGKHVHFQTTLPAALGNLEAAMRIARMCYYKLECGLSKPEVEQYRAEAYARLGGGFGRAKEAKPSKSKAPKKDQKEKEETKKPKAKIAKESKTGHFKEIHLKDLKEKGRLDGAIQLYGRDPKKKNSNVMGLYLPLADKFNGRIAYERFSPPGETPWERRLYYAEEKKRWKVSQALGDRQNFAFLVVEDGGKNPPSASNVTWSFFDGLKKSKNEKETNHGWGEDPQVKCIAFRWPKAKAVAQNQPKEESSGSASSSDSDSEAGDSGDSSASDSDEPEAARSAKVEASEVPKKPVKKPRACAKMMVRAGLRCSCHFRLLLECPGQMNRRSRSRDRDN